MQILSYRVDLPFPDSPALESMSIRSRSEFLREYLREYLLFIQVDHLWGQILRSTLLQPKAVLSG